MIAALGADYGGRALVKTDMRTGRSWILTGLFEGRPYNALNDIAIDERGRIYFTDPRYLGWESIEQPGVAAYRSGPRRLGASRRCGLRQVHGILVSRTRGRCTSSSNDNGWWEFQKLHEGEKTLQGAHALFVYDLAARRHAQQPPRLQGL